MRIMKDELDDITIKNICQTYNISNKITLVLYEQRVVSGNPHTYMYIKKVIGSTHESQILPNETSYRGTHTALKTENKFAQI